MMNDNLQKALISKDGFAVQMSTDYHDDSFDNKFLAAQLHKYKWSLLQVVKIGYADVTRLFLEANDSINVNANAWPQDHEGWTALHEAVYSFDVDQVKLLLDYNADPNSLGGCSKTPINLLYADENPNSDHEDGLAIIKMLADRGANAVIPGDNVNQLQVGFILLMGTAEEIEIILSMNISLREQYEHGDTVAHHLAANGRLEVWELMRDREFAVNVRNNHQETPLWCAATYGAIEAVKVLLSKGADVNAAGPGNSTPVYAATKTCAESKYEDYKVNLKMCIVLLLEYGADIQVTPVPNDGLPLMILDLLIIINDDSLYKLMLEHLALQEGLGTPITEIIRSKIESLERVQQYLDFCKQILAVKIYGSETAFHLLTCNEEKLIPYMRNKELVKILFDACDTMNMMVSGYYHRLLNKRLTKARQTAKLRDSAAVVIGELMQIDHDCLSLIVENIMSYLENRDLDTLLSLL